MTEEQEIFKQKCNAYGKTHHDGLSPEYIHLDIMRESEPKPEKSKCGVTDSLKKIALKSTEALRSKLNVTKVFSIVKNVVDVKKVYDTLTTVVYNPYSKNPIKYSGYDKSTQLMPNPSPKNVKCVNTYAKSRTVSVINTELIDQLSINKVEKTFLNFADACYKQGSSLLNKTVQFIIDGTVYTIE